MTAASAATRGSSSTCVQAATRYACATLAHKRPAAIVSRSSPSRVRSHPPNPSQEPVVHAKRHSNSLWPLIPRISVLIGLHHFLRRCSCPMDDWLGCARSFGHHTSACCMFAFSAAILASTEESNVLPTCGPNMHMCVLFLITHRTPR